MPKLRNRQFLMADLVALCTTPIVALLLRVDGIEAATPFLHGLILYTVLGLLVRLGVFYSFGLYRRYWRFATVDDLAHTVLAVVVATALMSFFVFGTPLFSEPGETIPRSIPLVDGLLILMVVGGTRFSVRLAERSMRQRPNGDARRVLVLGAGVAGQMIVRELLANPQLGLVPAGFLDDDAHKQGVRILNLPVLGPRDALPDVVNRYAIAQVVIAMPRAPGRTIRELLALCEDAGVPARTVPGMYEILGGSVSVNHLRKVEIEDLLRREPIHTDIAAVGDLIQGKRVLVTGAGGSIGSELCRQVLRCGPAELALLGHGENSVFDIHNELQRLAERSGSGRRPVLHALIADVRFAARVRAVVEAFRPDIIFHAAAHKHVPLMELNPVEAISNNVLGTQNLLDAAQATGVQNFVMISTDKAVNPTSVMGASKRAAELLVLRAARESGKRYVAVRFGNVLGSRGSVVLTFKRQISAGGPVTVSHPDMRRYFMTIPEAVQLVLQASVLGSGGEIFVLDMGEPVKVVDLARDLIELSGLEVDRDIDIVYSGIRPGEKLFEELFIPGERYEPTHHEKILIARNASSFVPPAMREVLAGFQAAVAANDAGAVRRRLQELIPEYQPEDARLAAPSTPSPRSESLPARGGVSVVVQ
ncbi:MAG TPA: nucleoside-diphosphate sugar epimerase/dehydratase [Armatimonadota bacterium]|nr:nucleoside-diphosphate sugar epimerase/dehydratase [Armatimonadota bacterium]